MAAALRAIRRAPPPSPRALGRRVSHDLDAIVGEAQRQQLLREVAKAQLADVRSLRAFRWAIRLRDAMLPVINPPRAALRRVRRLVRR